MGPALRAGSSFGEGAAHQGLRVPGNDRPPSRRRAASVAKHATAQKFKRPSTGATERSLTRSASLSLRVEPGSVRNVKEPVELRSPTPSVGRVSGQAPGRGDGGRNAGDSLHSIIGTPPIPARRDGWGTRPSPGDGGGTRNGSRVEGPEGSRVQEFKGSRGQEVKSSEVQEFKRSRVAG